MQHRKHLDICLNAYSRTEIEHLPIAEADSKIMSSAFVMILYSPRLHEIIREFTKTLK